MICTSRPDDVRKASGRQCPKKLREKVAYEKAFTMPANHETCAEVVAALREELDIL